jgi:hypothetical protein
MVRSTRFAGWAAVVLVLLLATWLPPSHAGTELGEAQAAHMAPVQDSRAGVEASAPVINVWYGTTQDFGALGNPQRQINILGNVQGASQLHYSLNNGPYIEVALGNGGAGSSGMGIDLWHPGGVTVPKEPLESPGSSTLAVPDSDRLIAPGDFNVEIATSRLLNGQNTVVLSANLGQATKTVTVRYTAGKTWPLPYTIKWNTVTKIADVAQIVDGTWTIGTTGIRPTAIGYDRVVAIGDKSWKDFDVLVPITIYSFPLTDMGGVGVAVRWQGHFQVVNEQPGAGWWELGAYGLYRNRSGDPDRSRLQMYTQHYEVETDSSGYQLATGKPYYFRLRVQTLSPSEGGFYSMKVWEAGKPEPATWTLEVQDQEVGGEPDLRNGSVLLVAHEADAAFGDVVIRPVLDVSVGTSGSGSVQVTPALAGQSDAYLHGDTLTFKAVPAPGWAFLGWSGDLTGTKNPATLTLKKDTNVVATFGTGRTLNVTTVGSGSVLLDPEGPSYAEGTVVTLRPSPDPGWGFSHWEGPDQGALRDNRDGTWSLTMNGDKAVTAVFAPGKYEVTVYVAPNGSGTVQHWPGNPYSDGAVATLQPVPKQDWGFRGWIGPDAGDVKDNRDGTWSLVMDGDKVVIALFGPPTAFLPLVTRSR